MDTAHSSEKSAAANYHSTQCHNQMAVIFNNVVKIPITQEFIKFTVFFIVV
jgi:hypothetical protein